MKQLTAKSKIICAVIILVIIIGAIVVYAKGFNFDLKYQQSKMMEIYIGKEFNIEDVKAITKEVFGNAPVLLQNVEVYEDTVAITTKEITDEQKTSIVEKMNEKYSLELKAEDITIESIPHTKLSDIMKPYLIPVVIATLVILLYMGTRYYKLGLIRAILETGLIAVIAQALLFSLMAIVRFPIGRYTIPLMLFVYLVSMLGVATKFENDLTKKRLEEEQEEK